MRQILINLSDSVYDAIKNKYTLVNPKEGTLIKTLWDAVENGTPLPEGHGDLIDRDALRESMHGACMGVMAGSDDYDAPLKTLDSVTAVIRKEGKE